VIDSSDFYGEGGKKLGLGSSAAVAVAVCACVAEAAGLPWWQVETELPRVANTAHRTAQGGRGSGYDVLASVHGGIGVVTGGRNPGWEDVELPWLSTIGLQSRRRSVRTGSAVASYERWKEAHAKEHREFLAASNRYVSELAGSPDFDTAKPILSLARDLGRNLGRAIGVSADIGQREDVDAPNEAAFASFCKALGAGNELVGCISRSGRCPAGFTAEEIDREGARWL
jgi:phosphomevalonate kinase